MTTLEMLQKLETADYREYGEAHGSLCCMNPYVSASSHGYSVRLDGEFDADELKLIVRWMEENQK